MKHELPKLPYPKEALAPFMSQETLEYHYSKHHQAYVDNLNGLIEGSEFEKMSLEEIILKSHQNKHQKIFNNSAQHYNHIEFWNSMKKDGGGNIPPLVQKKLEESFGSVVEFKNLFKQECLGLFGSGWAWLALNQDGKLVIKPYSNAGNPLIDSLKPVLGCDVWEHSYYIDYRNKRGDYVDAFLNNLINWEYIESKLV